MQLKIQRSQRPGGVLANKVVFGLDIRAEYNEKERADINKYRLGGEIVYASRKHQAHMANVQNAETVRSGLYSLAMAKMNLTITVASLARGHHIECKDLAEVLEAEATLREACVNIERHLALASSFDGGTVLLNYDENGEQQHFSNGVLEIASPSSSSLLSSPEPASISAPTTSSDFMLRLGTIVRDRGPLLIAAFIGLLVLFFLVRLIESGVVNIYLFIQIVPILFIGLIIGVGYMLLQRRYGK